MNTNLLSLGTFIRNRLSFRASKGRLTITDDENDTIMEGVLVTIVFKLRLSEFDDSRAREIAKAMSAKTLPHKKVTAKEWHETIGQTYLP